MNQTRQQVNRYLRQLKKLLPSDYPGRNDILQSIRQRIIDFLSEHPDTTTTDFEAEFGTPEEVADSFLEELSGSMRENKMRNKSKRYAIIGFILIILSVSILSFSWYLIQHAAVETTETITIYEDGPAPWED